MKIEKKCITASNFVFDLMRAVKSREWCKIILPDAIYWLKIKKKTIPDIVFI